MRALIFEPRPDALEHDGLIKALERQTTALSARHRIPIETTFCDEPDLSLPAKEALYRIGQEALNNAVKHAGASVIRVVVTCAPGTVALEVRDDGAGFDPLGDFPGHLGLRSMRERAEHLAGGLSIDSALGRGTRLQVRVPGGPHPPAPSPSR